MTRDNSTCFTGLSAQRGFSLIDLAVIMAIVGVLLAGFLATYKMYQATRSSTVTEENFIAAQDALGAFVALNKRYPRPAPFGLADGQAGYGEEAAAGAATACTATNASGKVCSGSGHGGDVLVGVLPVAALNMSDVQARDGMGRLFTYAVSAALTQAESAPGVPTKLDDEGIYAVCVNANELTDDGVFDEVACGDAGNPARPIALISHGKDGIGAWLPSGRQYRACGTGADKQNDNCNNDGAFSISLRRVGDDDAVNNKWAPRLPMLVEGENNNKNDDMFRLEIREDSNFWVKDGSSDRMDNRHNYKVGIGTSDPKATLDVNGGIKVENKFLAEELCNSDGSGSATCLKVDAIAGDLPEMACPGDTGIVVDIRNNTVTCEYLAKVGDCGVGEYLVRIDDQGTPVCGTLPATCGPSAVSNLTGAPTSGLCGEGVPSAVTEPSPRAYRWTCSSGSSTSPERMEVSCHAYWPP